MQAANQVADSDSLAEQIRELWSKDLMDAVVLQEKEAQVQDVAVASTTVSLKSSYATRS